MGDPGFVSGFIGVSLDIAIHQIFHHVSIALRCNEELICLRDLVMRIQPTITQIQQYRLALNRKRGIPVSQSDINIKASDVNEWLKKLNSLLRKASAMAQECTIRKYDLISGYRTSRRITRLISDITKHLDLVGLMGWASVLQGLGQIAERVDALAASSSDSTSATTSEPVASTGIIISEPIIVGQLNALERLEKLLTDAEVHSLGVVGKGGSGKTLLLKTLFNSQKVRDHFRDDLLIWLTVSESPSLKSLWNELRTQIAMQTKVHPHTIMNIPLNESMQGKKFALFLDDIWGQGYELLEYLGVLRLFHVSSCKIIVSSRSHRALLETGVAKESTITMEDLIEDDSWRLFCYYAFPCSNGKVAPHIDEETVKVVCHKCGGLPLAVKAVGRALAGITDAQEWHFAVQRLPNANSRGEQAVYARLRLSYDALGSYDVHLQLAFLYLAAAFLEDQVVPVGMATLLWIGEGLLAGHNPFEMGIVYANVLADRCLIEPTLRDVDGRVVFFRMHDVLRGLAIQIAEEEENFYCRSGKGSTELNINGFSSCTRIVLNDNILSSLSESLRAPEISSLLLNRNPNFTEIPKKVVGSMMSLKVLNLSNTSVQSLPESVGCLKQLVYLDLGGVPIKKLPASFTNLAALQILMLESSKITELPSDIHRLRSLIYLDLDRCEDLKYLPRSISRLTSLQILYMRNCSSMMWTSSGKKRYKKAASIDSLSTLTQLKVLALDNHGETISDGTLKSMVDMEKLVLILTKMEILPHGMFNISKLRKLMLECPDMVRIESQFCEFHNLTILQLWCCEKLEELPDLHKLKSLRQLDISMCEKLKKFPEEFGKKGGFPLLEKFSIVRLNELEELPEIEEGAMSSLKIFTIMLCEALKIFPESYLNLKQLQKLRVYGCSMISENLKTMEEKINAEIKMVTMSTIDTQECTKECTKQYEQVKDTFRDSCFFTEFFTNEFTNEFYLFLEDLCRTF